MMTSKVIIEYVTSLPHVVDMLVKVNTVKSIGYKTIIISLYLYFTIDIGIE